MGRWALLGLLTLSACSDSGGIAAQFHEECLETLASPKPPARASDGREAVLVRYRPDDGVSAASVGRLGGPVKASYHLTPAVAMRVTPGERARLAADPRVEAIEPDLRVRALGLPSLAGSVDEYTDALRLIQAPRVWDANEDGMLDATAVTGAGIRVCVIDSGLDRSHPELTLPYAAGHDFVDGDDDPSDETAGERGLGHGTHVAGIIAAQLASGGITAPGMSRGGMMGVAPGVDLLIARVLDVDETASVSDVISALEWCQEKRAHVVSLSLGAPMDMGRSARQAFQAAHDAGMLIVAAAGNDSRLNYEAPLSYPAAYPSVLAVGAVDTHEQLAVFSNRGPGLSLVAPGVDVLSSVSTQGATVSELETLVERYPSRSLFFAPAGEYLGELVDCGQGEAQGCHGGTCGGFVAYVRMEQNYNEVTKLARNVMRQGARAIVFGVGDSEQSPGQMSLKPPMSQWVPMVMVGRESRAAVLQNLGKGLHVRLRGVDYARLEGTSMAAPHVTGAAALVWSARPSLTATQVRSLLEDSARDLGEPGPDARHGHGLVQVQAALEALQRMP